jgi:non-specific serine/threonine protein kinase
MTWPPGRYGPVSDSWSRIRTRPGRCASRRRRPTGLVVDADAVWRSRGKLKALARHLDSPQETLLAELGKAGRLYPELDAALRTPRPSVLSLDTDSAHQFLRTVAPTLATAGFGVQLPGWWAKPSSRLGLRLTASTPAQPGRVEAGRVLGFDALAEFRYQLAVGGEVLSDAELAERADLKAPMVRLRGQWIELLRLIGRTEAATVGELLRLGLGIGSTDLTDELPNDGVDADGWLGELLSGRVEHRLAAVDVPA